VDMGGVFLRGCGRKIFLNAEMGAVEIFIALTLSKNILGENDRGKKILIVIARLFFGGCEHYAVSCPWPVDYRGCLGRCRFLYAREWRERQYPRAGANRR